MSKTTNYIEDVKLDFSWVSKEQEDYVMRHRLAAENFDKAEAERLGFDEDLALPRESWKAIDRRAVKILRTGARVYSALMGSASVAVPVEKTIYEYSATSDMGEVTWSRTFSDNDANRDTAELKTRTEIMPAAQLYWEMQFEDYTTDATSGGMIQMANGDAAMENMARSMEDMILNGKTDVRGSGQDVEGLLSAPTGDRARLRAATAGNLRTDTNLGATWENNVEKGIDMLVAQGISLADGFTMLCHTQDLQAAMFHEYSTGYPKKVYDVVRELPGITRIVDSQYLFPANTLIFIANGDWLRFPTALPMTTFPVVAARADRFSPRAFRTRMKGGNVIVRDYNNKTGISVIHG